MAAFAESEKIEHPSEIPAVDRRYQRVDVTLFGRYMLANKQEFPCQVLNMSPGAVAMVTPHSGQTGERVVAYIDHIGRLEGEIVRLFDGGFSMSINATERKRDKMAAQLTWLANRHELNLAEDRRNERLIPKQRVSEVRLEDGRAYKVRIIDLSLSGAAFEMDVRPAIGTILWLGNLRGRVVRHFDDGVAVEFAAVQSKDSLQQFLAN